MRLNDVEFVTQILDEMEGERNVLKAHKIVRLLGKRIRQRKSERADPAAKKRVDEDR